MKSFVIPVLQTLIICLIALSFFATSWFGDEYVLRAEPYDPYDPFYGEYVLLKYPDLKPSDSAPEGDIFFSLKEGDDGYALIDRIDREPFWGAIQGTNYGGQITTPQLEQYYVEQGTGPGLEEAKDLALTLDVAPWGAIRPTFLEKRQEQK